MDLDGKCAVVTPQRVNGSVNVATCDSRTRIDPQGPSGVGAPPGLGQTVLATVYGIGVVLHDFILDSGPHRLRCRSLTTGCDFR